MYMCWAAQRDKTEYKSCFTFKKKNYPIIILTQKKTQRSKERMLGHAESNISETKAKKKDIEAKVEK